MLAPGPPGRGGMIAVSVSVVVCLESFCLSAGWLAWQRFCILICLVGVCCPALSLVDLLPVGCWWVSGDEALYRQGSRDRLTDRNDGPGPLLSLLLAQVAQTSGHRLDGVPAPWRCRAVPICGMSKHSVFDHFSWGGDKVPAPGSPGRAGIIVVCPRIVSLSPLPRRGLAPWHCIPLTYLRYG